MFFLILNILLVVGLGLNTNGKYEFSNLSKFDP